MKAVVEDDEEGSAHEEGSAQALAAAERVSFMYELEKGSSPKSYGINVARLARLPAQVIAQHLSSPSLVPSTPSQSPL